MPYIRAEPPCRGRERKDLWLLNSGTNPSATATAATASRRASRRSCARRVDLSPRRRAMGEEREFQAGSGSGTAEGVASGCAGIFMNLFHRARKPEFRERGKRNARASRAGTARVREASQVPSLRVTYGVGEFFFSFPVFGLPLIRDGCYHRELHVSLRFEFRTERRNIPRTFSRVRVSILSRWN